MATQTIGIIVNGATGRIGSTQHLANALVPIIEEGGLPLGDDRLLPRLLLVGRDRRAPRGGRTRRTISRDWSTDLDAALSDPDYAIFFDAAATQQRFRTLERAIAAGKHVYSEKPVAPTAAQAHGLAASGARPRPQARRGRGQGPPSGHAEACGAHAAAASSVASWASGSSSAGGCSTAPTGPASDRAGTIAPAAEV